MAPSKSSSPSSSVKAHTKMKQSTLGFTSAKRSNSLGTKSKKLTTSSLHPLKPADKDEHSTLGIRKRGTPQVEFHEISSDHESSSTVSSNSTRWGAKSTAKSVIRGAQKGAEPEGLDVEDKAGRYTRYYNEVGKKMGNVDPIHADGQNKIHHMLRAFDLCCEYGPCVGMTRLERWERAEVLGLDPPREVHDILSTKEGIEKEEYAQCVLYGEV